MLKWPRMEKILVRAPNWLGDAVMCLPFLKRLLSSRPGAVVDVLCRPSLLEIFRAVPGIRETFPVRGFWETVNDVRSRAYDAAFALPPSFSSAFHLFLARVPARAGYATDYRRLLLTSPLPLDERLHYVRRYLGLLGMEGAEVGKEDFVFPSAGGGMPAQLAGIPGPCIAVAPGSRAPARRWFPERFADLVNALEEKEWPAVLLLGAPDDAPWVSEVESRCRRPVVNLCGKTSLPVLGDVLRNCRALITNESGLMHAAWAVGTPTIALAGPSDPRVTSPFGNRIRVLQHREVPCVPCVRNECYRLGNDYKECMKRINVEEVLQALREVLG